MKESVKIIIGNMFVGCSAIAGATILWLVNVHAIDGHVARMSDDHSTAIDLIEDIRKGAVVLSAERQAEKMESILKYDEGSKNIIYGLHKVMKILVGVVGILGIWIIVASFSSAKAIKRYEH